MIEIFVEIVLRHIRTAETIAISGACVSSLGVIGLAGTRLLGFVGNIDPTFWSMIIVGIGTAFGNAWIEYKWRARRREIDVRTYERQRRIDLIIYEKQREKESGFEVDVINTPDPD